MTTPATKQRFMIAIPCDPERIEEVLNIRFSWGAGATEYTKLCSRDGGRIDPVWRMQEGYEHAKYLDYTLIAYIHSDVEIYDSDWIERCLKEFEDPQVGVVGFGGALGLGHPDIYKAPYALQQLARFDYRSNAVDAEFHGARNMGGCDVATLDGFCLIVRVELLDRMGGLPVASLYFHNYDNAICCYARRHGYRVRQVGVSCKHRGGGHSTKGRWQQRCLEDFGMTDAQLHEASHLWLYSEFRDVLPIRVESGSGEGPP